MNVKFINQQADNDIVGKSNNYRIKKFEFFPGFSCVLKKLLYICTPQ